MADACVGVGIVVGVFVGEEYIGLMSVVNNKFTPQVN